MKQRPKKRPDVIPAKAGIKTNPRLREDDRDFLLEIGCEEIPADYMPSALDWEEQAEGLMRSASVGLNLTWKEMVTYGTPRRLVLLVREVEPVVKKEEKGPPVDIAFDAQGKPTRAAEAFAQRHGLKVSQLVRRQTAKGEMVSAEYEAPAAKILAEAVPRILQGIRFPKTMRWDASAVRFARPIRWLLALYGSTPVKSSFGLVETAPVTYGTRRSGSRPVPVRSASDYFTTVKRLGVHLEDGWGFRKNPDGFVDNLKAGRSKRAALLTQLESAARKCAGRLPDQTTEEFHWLLDTVTFLAEDPVVQAGSFRTEYLDLPPEVLATAMAKHLRIFSVYASDGKKLLPKFLAVLEGTPSQPGRVMANYERILEARFTDARFFYKEDTRAPLAAKVPELAKVAFHEKLGSVKERVDHLGPLILKIASDLRLPSVSKHARRAAELCKADLVTQMVREFPSLQGIIGAQYARQSAESEEIARAIAEHYRPRTAEDSVPSTLLGGVLSLADRLDTLIGYFGAGLKPTGSMDPYALRRQALGFVRILLEPPPGCSFVGLSIDRISEQGIQSWGSRFHADPKVLKKELHSFLLERFEWLCRWRHRTDPTLANAVLAADSDDLAGAWERLKILRSLWSDGNREGRHLLERAAKVAERTGRIVQSVRGAELPAAVDPSALKEPAERELWGAWNEVAPRVREQLDRRQYEEALLSYSTLYPVVHTFFEKVFVMDENLELRRNRLAMLKEIHHSLASRFADLAKLPLAGMESS